MKRIIKQIIKYSIYSIVFLVVVPFGYSAKLLHKLLKTPLLFDLFAQSFSMIPGFPGNICRACYYKQTLHTAHLDLDIGFGSFVSKIGTKIGKGVLITGHTTIGLAEIGDGAVIANYVSVLSGRYQHNFSNPERGILEGADTYSCLSIGKGSFIGDNSTIMANVGCNSIVGAGSVVVKDIPDYVVAVGNPAKVVKQRK